MKKNNDMENYNKYNEYFVFHKMKDNHTSFIDRIPEQYKRSEYIIDRIKCKKKNVE